jgi:DNA-binding transcriptional ArsR family regulator
MPAKRAVPTLTLTSLAQVQALAHPLRFRAFERLTVSARTGKQLAQDLGTKPTQLYHHLKVLERAGLIRRVATRKTRGTTEKYFQAAADRVVVDPRLWAGRVSARQALAGQVLRVTFDEMTAAQARFDQPRAAGVLLKRLRIRTTPAAAGRLRRQLENWLTAFAEASDPAAGNEYALTVAFYQVAPSHD